MSELFAISDSISVVWKVTTEDKKLALYEVSQSKDILMLVEITENSFEYTFGEPSVESFMYKNPLADCVDKEHVRAELKYTNELTTSFGDESSSRLSIMGAKVTGSNSVKLYVRDALDVEYEVCLELEQTVGSCICRNKIESVLEE